VIYINQAVNKTSSDFLLCTIR